MDPLQEMVSNFNPHHHAGGDTLIPDHKGATKYFNPHHHAGGDYAFVTVFDNNTISIHTTTQVVTSLSVFLLLFILISIHTTTQVVTGKFCLIYRFNYISIHTTTQVVTGTQHTG